MKIVRISVEFIEKTIKNQWKSMKQTTANQWKSVKNQWQINENQPKNSWNLKKTTPKAGLAAPAGNVKALVMRQLLRQHKPWRLPTIFGQAELIKAQNGLKMVLNSNEDQWRKRSKINETQWNINDNLMKIDRKSTTNKWTSLEHQWRSVNQIITTKWNFLEQQPNNQRQSIEKHMKLVETSMKLDGKSLKTH